MLKKFAIWFWPIMRQVLLMALEKQIQETLYGKPKPRKYGSALGPISYNRMSAPPVAPKPKPPTPRFTEPITFHEKEKADLDELLARLRDVEFDYNRAHVADLVELMNMGASTYADNMWGWRDLSDCEVLIDPLYPEVWSLTLPRPIYLG